LTESLRDFASSEALLKAKTAELARSRLDTAPEPEIVVTPGIAFRQGTAAERLTDIAVTSAAELRDRSVQLDIEEFVDTGPLLDSALQDIDPQGTSHWGTERLGTSSPELA